MCSAISWWQNAKVTFDAGSVRRLPGDGTSRSLSKLSSNVLLGARDVLRGAGDAPRPLGWPGMWWPNNIAIDVMG
jgi:hypothetical protein